MIPRRYGSFSSLAVACLLCAVATQPVAAQDFELTSSNIAEGAAGIAIVDTFYFEFTRRLPFNSLFTSGFHWEPEEEAHRSNAFLDADRIRPRFTITHQPDTDYAVYVYGVRAENGSYMARPFTLNYTTAETHGSISVRGDIETGERSAVQWFNTARLRNVIAAEFAASLDASRPGESVGEKQPTPGHATDVTHSRKTSANASYDQTIVFLLDEFSLEQERWSVKAAETLDAEGRFEFQHVRPGIYYPIAIQFSGPEADVIDAYGFYDPDGDFAPNAVSVQDDLSGITLGVYPFQRSTAFAYTELTEPLLAQRADSMDLIAVSSLDVTSSGLGAAWTFDYYSEGEDSVYTVQANPITITIASTGASPLETVLTAIHVDEVIDSDEALDIAGRSGGSDFLADAETDDITIALRGGSLFDEWPTDPLRLLWRVRYEHGHPLDPDFESLIVYVDMQSGVVVDVVSTSTEAITEMPSEIILRQNYPNPFNPSTTIGFDLEHSAHVSLHVYNVLGRRIETLLDRAIPAGSHEILWRTEELPSGTYFYKIEAGGTSQTRSMILMR